jgi:hypothetical protein
MSANASHEQHPLDIRLPQEVPVLSEDAARVLLQILIDAVHKKRRQHEHTTGSSTRLEDLSRRR